MSSMIREGGKWGKKKQWYNDAFTNSPLPAGEQVDKSQPENNAPAKKEEDETKKTRGDLVY